MIKILVGLLLTILFFYEPTSCWRLILKQANIVYMHPDMINATINVKKINKTTFALNYTGDLHVDCSPAAEVIVRLYGLYSNTYRPLPCNVKRNLCDHFKNEFQFLGKLNGHFPDSCPVKRGHYYFRDFVADTSRVPFSNPWKVNSILVNVTVSHGWPNERDPNLIIATIVLDSSIEDELFRTKSTNVTTR